MNNSRIDNARMRELIVRLADNTIDDQELAELMKFRARQCRPRPGAYARVDAPGLRINGRFNQKPKREYCPGVGQLDPRLLILAIDPPTPAAEREVSAAIQKLCVEIREARNPEALLAAERPARVGVAPRSA
jgi:hypothetical protein